MGDQRDLVRKEFALQARAYDKAVRFQHPEKVTPMVDLAKPTMWDRVLDVASGWGLVALAFASRVRSVTGVDLTPEMVDLAKRVAAEKRVGNVDYAVGDAEDLKFDPGSFDIVTCRAAFHHLGDPERALRQMKRVLATGGRIVLYEFVSSASPEKATLYHKIESTRDPSHIRSFSTKDFQELFLKCGLEEKGRVVSLVHRDFDQWMASVEAEPERKEKVRALLESSIQGDRAGLGPRLRGAELAFTHTCVAWLLVTKA